jgi:hypothetical protein
MFEFIHNQRGRASSALQIGRASWRVGVVGLLAAVAVPVLGVATAGAIGVAPSAPTAVSAVGATGQATVDFTVGADGGSAITAFVVTPYINGTAGPSTTYPAGAVGSALDPTSGAMDSVVFSPLPSSTGYTFAIAETNAIATSPLSAQTNSVSSVAPVTSLLSVSPTSHDFGSLTLGDISDDQIVTFTNIGTGPDTISKVNFGGADPFDFVLTADSNCVGAVLAPQQSCTATVAFLPGATGHRTATLTPADTSGSPTSVTLSGTGTEGYYVATANGVVKNFGDAVDQGGLGGQAPAAPIVTITSTGDNAGYWLLDSLGDVYAVGDADSSFGDLGGTKLNQPIVGMAATPDDGGYWLVASDGGIFSYGDAPFYGSTGAIKLNKPIVGMASTPDGGGYWLVASDGGIFAFGDATFHGSTGAIKLNKPVVGMASTPDGNGYWLVASDGGIFSFGDAKFYGSTGAIKLNQPIVGMAATPDGHGYWLVASDGGIFNFGDAPFDGSAGGQGITNAIGMAISGYSTFQASIDVPADRALALKHELAAHH